MTELTRAIPSCEHEKVQALISSRPELISIKEGDWYPRDWAHRAGNLSAYLVLKKLNAPTIYPDRPGEEILKSYIASICSDYFCANWQDKIDASLWNQLYQGQEVFFEGQDPEYGLSKIDKDNLFYLIECCGITSYAAWQKALED